MLVRPYETKKNHTSSENNTYLASSPAMQIFLCSLNVISSISNKMNNDNNFKFVCIIGPKSYCR